MNDGSFPLAQVMFHLVLMLVLHGQQVQRGTKTVRNRRREQKPVRVMPPGFRLRTNRDRRVPKAKGNTMKPAIRYRSQPRTLSGELQTKSCHSNPTGTEGRTGCASGPGRSSDQYI